MREHNVYRGRVISFHAGHGSLSVRFPVLSHVLREAVILPDGVLERLERHALGVSAQRKRLTAGGRHLKRGILLHGPPGTGKTHTVTYLLGAMPGRTTVILTGQSLGLVEQATTIARQLAPATVVLEDVDLIAAERTMPGGHGPLFELLNQMEGLESDEDLLFVLTTNRADVLEPALAARPGRVDLALEVPLPDAAARERLLALYAAEIPLDEEVTKRLVQGTEGVAGAFIKELIRQAALRAALGERDTAAAADLEAALADLLDERAALTRRLLGQPGGDPPYGPGLAADPAAIAMARAANVGGLRMGRQLP
jgi:cell division protease FtsH